MSVEPHDSDEAGAARPAAERSPLVEQASASRQRASESPSKAALRVLLVDDEPLASMRLRTLVEECPQPQAVVVGTASTAAQALAWLDAHSCDVALLDVQMPGRDGTQLAAELRQRGQACAVVFVTAHAQHALAAFELDAVDYLTKPVRRERLQAALQRVVERLALRLATPAREAPVIVVTDRGRLVRVPVAEIVYLKAELKYVTLRTADHRYVLDGALSDLEQRLGPGFLRVHRNALVARRCVRALERRVVADESDDEGSEQWAVRMSPVDEWLAVSRRQVGAVRETLASEGL